MKLLLKTVNYKLQLEHVKEDVNRDIWQDYWTVSVKRKKEFYFLSVWLYETSFFVANDLNEKNLKKAFKRAKRYIKKQEKLSTFLDAIKLTPEKPEKWVSKY